MHSAPNSPFQILVEVLATLIAAGILGFLAMTRRWVRRELIDPVHEVRVNLKRHIKEDRKYQKRTNRRLSELSGGIEVVSQKTVRRSPIQPTERHESTEGEAAPAPGV